MTGQMYKDARDPAFDVAQVRGQQRVPAHCCRGSFQGRSLSLIGVSVEE